VKEKEREQVHQKKISKQKTYLQKSAKLKRSLKNEKT
jgi:hypothetical protein